MISKETVLSHRRIFRDLLFPSHILRSRIRHYFKKGVGQSVAWLFTTQLIFINRQPHMKLAGMSRALAFPCGTWDSFYEFPKQSDISEYHVHLLIFLSSHLSIYFHCSSKSYYENKALIKEWGLSWGIKYSSFLSPYL